MLIAIALLIALGLLLVVGRVLINHYKTKSWRDNNYQTLRSTAPYAPDTTNFHFTQITDTVRATEVYNYFRLDTLLSPTASTWDNAMRMARMIARAVPHHNNPIGENKPQVLTSIGLWEHNQKRPGLNCRQHSIMLYEMLTAAGIKARYVTCLPEDSTDRDCHVVNHVWLPELRKWAMLDSDGFFYYTLPNDTIPLSLAEMRLHIIDRHPMQLNGLDTTANAYAQHDKKWKRPYWSKNLYWFEVHEQHCFGRENDERPADRLIALIPSGWQAFVKHGQAIKTTDEARFWAAPEE